MRKSLIALMVIVFMCFASLALAEEAQKPVTSDNKAQGPVMLTDTQLDNIVAAGMPRNTTNYLWDVPGNHENATPQYTHNVWSARPTEDRTNYNSNKSNAYFYYY
jgi:hypothetical protein